MVGLQCWDSLCRDRVQRRCGHGNSAWVPDCVAAADGPRPHYSSRRSRRAVEGSQGMAGPRQRRRVAFWHPRNFAAGNNPGPPSDGKQLTARLGHVIERIRVHKLAMRLGTATRTPRANSGGTQTVAYRVVLCSCGAFGAHRARAIGPCQAHLMLHNKIFGA